MKQTFRFCRTALVCFGLVVVLGGAVQSQEHPADSSRDSIIQSVRDDVRRKIRDQQAAEYRAGSATVGQTSARVYRPKKPKKPNSSK
jgi:hypothetical protein